MAAEPHYIDVDLKKSTHYKTTTVTQNDTDVVFILRVSDDGRSDESVLDNFSTVTLTSQRRDGQSFYVLGEKIPGTNEVRFALGTKELELTGKVSASAQLYSVDGRQSSAKFNYNVEGDLTGDYVPTETEATLIEIVLMDGPATIAEAEQVTAQTVEALELLETEKTVAFQELDDVKEDNKLTWKPEVATVALRNSTYPNPQNGDTVRITEEARIDRFNGTEWITTDRYNPNALDLVHQQLADTTVKLAETAKKSEVDAKVAQIVSGTPKGTYATLADLQSSFPAGATGVYVVAEDGKWYYWNQMGAWTAGGVYQSTGIPKNSLTLDKTTFGKVGKNLLDRSASTSGFYLNNTNGNNAANASYSVSDFIPIKPSTNYTFTLAVRLAFYDESKTFISGSASIANPVQSPANAKFLRVDFLTANNNVQVEQGDAPTEFEAFKQIIDKAYLEPTFSLEQIPRDSLGKEKLNFVVAGKNLFNAEEATPNKYINQSNGLLSTSTSYHASDFMPVNPGRSYIATQFDHYAWYDSEKVFISGDTLSGSSTSIVAPDNAYFIRVTVRNAVVSYYQFEEGSTKTSYEPYRHYLDGVFIKAPESLTKLINLPQEIPAVVGQELNVYFSNIISKADNFDIDVKASEGKQLAKRYSHTFTAAKEIPFDITKYNDGEEIAVKSSKIIAKTAAQNTSSFVGLVIGDSTTDATAAYQKSTGFMLKEFENDASSNLTLIGTRGVSPDFHEGRSGWTSARYVLTEVSGGVVNAFWNPATSGFDFSYYMAQTGYQTPTHVMINLGINDMFSANADNAAQTKAQETIGYYDTMIQSIKAHDSNIKVCIALTIPPNKSQDVFGDTYGADQVLWRYKRNNEIFVDALIKRYDKRKAEGIYVIPTNLSLNTETDILDGVHPNAAGYEKVGKSYYQFLKVLG